MITVAVSLALSTGTQRLAAACAASLPGPGQQSLGDVDTDTCAEGQVAGGHTGNLIWSYYFTTSHASPHLGCCTEHLVVIEVQGGAGVVSEAEEAALHHARHAAPHHRVGEPRPALQPDTAECSDI